MASSYGYRQFVPFLVLSLLLGCGTEPAPESTAPPLGMSLKPYAEGEAPDPYIDEELLVNLGVVTAHSDAYSQSVITGIREAAAELEVDLVELRSPEDGSVDQQNKLCMELFDEDISGIAVSPIDPDGQIRTLDRLNSLLETITFGTDSPGSERQIHVGVDDYQLGRDCAQLLASLSPDGGKVVLIADRLDGGSASLRRQGLIDALLGRELTAEHYRSNDDAWDPVDQPIAGEKFSVVATLVDGEDQPASEQLPELVKTEGNIVTIVGLCGRFVPESLAATEGSQLPDGMKWIGLGYDAGLIQSIEQGRCHAAIIADPHPLGKEVIEILKNVVQLQRSKLPKDGFAITPAVQVTPDNIESLVAQWQSTPAPQ